MADSFDYRVVWTPELMSRRVIVHAKPAKFSLVPDGPGKRAYHSRCGRARLLVQYYDEQGRPAESYARGAQLYAGHAKAIGAHWCKLCFRDETDRG